LIVSAEGQGQDADAEALLAWAKVAAQEDATTESSETRSERADPGPAALAHTDVL
jgi:hypothetical protein